MSKYTSSLAPLFPAYKQQGSYYSPLIDYVNLDDKYSRLISEHEVSHKVVTYTPLKNQMRLFATVTYEIMLNLYLGSPNTLLPILEDYVIKLTFIIENTVKINELYADLRSIAVGEGRFRYAQEYLLKEEGLNVEAYGSGYKEFYYWAKDFYHHDLKLKLFMNPLTLALIYSESLVVGFGGKSDDKEYLDIVTNSGKYSLISVEVTDLEKEIFKRFKKITSGLRQALEKNPAFFNILLDPMDYKPMELVNLVENINLKDLRPKWIISFYETFFEKKWPRYDQLYYFEFMRRVYNLEKKDVKEIEPYIKTLGWPFHYLDIIRSIWGTLTVIMAGVISTCHLNYFSTFRRPVFEIPLFFQKGKDLLLVKYQSNMWELLSSNLTLEPLKPFSVTPLELILILNSILAAYIKGSKCFECPLANLRKIHLLKTGSVPALETRVEDYVEFNYYCNRGKFVEDIVDYYRQTGWISDVSENGCCLAR